MSGYFLAAEDATSWPDALVTLGGFVLVAFFLWLLFHD